MTATFSVIPAKLNWRVMPPGHDCGVRSTPHQFNGIQLLFSADRCEGSWIPAFAGMTMVGVPE